jgi:hypothetical protein
MYGFPLAGMAAGVLASTGVGGENILIEAVMVLAGLSFGLVTGRWLVGGSTPRLEFESFPPHMISEPEDPGKKQ